MTLLALPITYIISLLIITSLVVWLVLINDTKRKFFIIIIYMFSVGFLYFSASEILSYPKPTSREYFNNNPDLKVTVLYYKIYAPYDIIFLYQFPGDDIPRYYIEDYTDKVASDLLNKAAEAEKSKGKLARGNPFFRGNETDKKRFYVIPQPRFLPPKEDLYSPTPSQDL